MTRSARWSSLWAVVLAGAWLAQPLASCAAAPDAAAGKTSGGTKKSAARPAAVEKIVKSEQDWKKTLNPTQYHVLREKGTERAFTGKYWDHHERGVYVCAACGLPLFDSSTKFDSGTGWPSFWAPIAKENVEEHRDATLGMIRIEATCARCGGHLGHIFDDGPKPTGVRYCMNSVSLGFEPKK